MKFRLITVCMGLAVAALSTSALAEDILRLNFGVYSSNKPSAMVKVFKPTLKELERRMSEKLGVEVDIRMQIAKDYDQGISHLTSGKVDFSRFGPASYLEAKRMNRKIQIAALESKNFSKVSYGIIAVREDSDITDISQIAGRSFAFGDEGSTIGRFLSQRYLQEAGILAEDLSNYEYLGRHDIVGTAVGAGDFDAGALNESTFKKLIDKGVPIRELVRFPNVAKPWIARAGLDPVVFNALTASLLEIKEIEALKGLKTDGFLEGTDSDYKQIRVAMENNYEFFEKREDNTRAAATAAANVATGLNAPPITSTQASVSKQTTLLPGVNTMTSNENKGDYVTINITLPPGSLDNPKTAADGSKYLTINLIIPPSIEAQEALDSADAGEL